VPEDMFAMVKQQMPEINLGDRKSRILGDTVLLVDIGTIRTSL